MRHALAALVLLVALAAWPFPRLHGEKCVYNVPPGVGTLAKGLVNCGPWPPDIR